MSTLTHQADVLTVLSPESRWVGHVLVSIMQVHCYELQVCLASHRDLTSAQVENDEVVAMDQAYGYSLEDYRAKDIPCMASNLWLGIPDSRTYEMVQRVDAQGLVWKRVDGCYRWAER